MSHRALGLPCARLLPFCAACGAQAPHTCQIPPLHLLPDLSFQALLPAGRALQRVLPRALLHAVHVRVNRPRVEPPLELRLRGTSLLLTSWVLR